MQTGALTGLTGYTPALTGYSYKYLPFRATWSPPLPKNDKVRSIRLQFVNHNSVPNPVKSYGYIKCLNSSSPTPIKSPRGMKPYWKSQKRSYLLR